MKNERERMRSNNFRKNRIVNTDIYDDYETKKLKDEISKL